jgi:hypothetical protein
MPNAEVCLPKKLNKSIVISVNGQLQEPTIITHIMDINQAIPPAALFIHSNCDIIL